MLKIKSENQRIAPLDEVRITGAGDNTVSVRDSEGREYARGKAPRAGLRVRVGGSLGTHVVLLHNRSGRVVDQATFKVDCSSWIHDDGNRFGALLGMLFHTMRTWCEGPTWVRFHDKYYKYYVCWLRDHVHTLKGMKYFDGVSLQTGIELYSDHQREDGMIWDRFQKHSPHENWRDFTFKRGGFVRKIENDQWRFERIPVENDVEYLFVEGLYCTWKATGDDAWMTGLLDSAIKAYRYSMKDPYRWSSVHKLLKRGFTIDTWDFQSAKDAAITGAAMVVDKDKTRFGVMHGDNTGFIVGCRYLSEMLAVAGRKDESEKWFKTAERMQKRLDKVAWNGEFYTHHVPEDPKLKRDLGVDLDSQVSLSNAYDLNRAIPHEHCVEIIKTYQRIREEMPASSPGEFYQIYPPFEKGFGGHNGKWHYMNGGVTTIVAGELAHGAFEHGFEQYGVDILDRVRGWGEAHDGYLDCCYRGAAPEERPTEYQPVDLRGQANVDFAGEGDPDNGVIGWINEGVNDLAEMPTGDQEFLGKPFQVIDPAANGRKACIGLSTQEGYARDRVIGVNAKAASLYFLHAISNGGGMIGTVELRYADGSRHLEYLYSGRQVGSWFMPEDPRFGGNQKLRTSDVVYRLAWRGANRYFPNVGVYAYGLNNPHPDREINNVVLTVAETGVKWFTLALTCADQPVLFPTNDISFGIPDNWGAGAVVYALFEGLAGIKDTGRAFNRALVAPRWSAAGTKQADVTAKYEASGGYVRYSYQATEDGKAVVMSIAGNAEKKDLELLLPEGASVSGVTVDGESVPRRIKAVEESQYLCVPLKGIAVHDIVVEMDN